MNTNDYASTDQSLPEVLGICPYFSSSITFTQHTDMTFQTLTDEQLIGQVNALGQEILSTSNEDPNFDVICDTYDDCVAELDARGLW